jgi:hypothetical protein
MGIIVTSEASANPGANQLHIQFDSTGTGTPAETALEVVDSSGNKTRICRVGATPDYRLIAVRFLTSSTSYTPTVGTRAIYVECIGGGGQGGGAPASSSQNSAGGGGGGGAYAASLLSGAQVKNPTTYAIGAGGSTGVTGAS